MSCPKDNPKIPQTVVKTIKKSDPTLSLKKKLAICDLEVKNYIRELETKIKKLVAQNGKLEVEKMTLNARIKTLLKQIKEKGPSLSELIKKIDPLA